MFLIRHRHDHFNHADPQVEARLRNVDDKLELIIRNQEAIMATRQEVRDDIQAVLTEVRATRGAAESAIAWAKGLLEQVGNAATEAADLDAFRADLALIKTEAQATEDELKAAVPANPA